MSVFVLNQIVFYMWSAFLLSPWISGINKLPCHISVNHMTSLLFSGVMSCHEILITARYFSEHLILACKVMMPSVTKLCFLLQYACMYTLLGQLNHWLRNNTCPSRSRARVIKTIHSWNFMDHEYVQCCSKDYTNNKLTKTIANWTALLCIKSTIFLKIMCIILCMIYPVTWPAFNLL